MTCKLHSLLTQIFADDVVGKILAILALTPLYVGAALSGLVLRCRDLHTVSHCNETTDNFSFNIFVDFLFHRDFVK